MKHRWLPALALIVAGAGLPARIASAGPVEQRQAEAKRIAAERERLVQEAERLNERVNAANDELTRLSTAVSASIGAVEQQQAAVGHLRERLSAFAIASYMQSDGTDQLASVLSGVNDVGLRRGYAPIVLGDQADLLDQVRAATQDLDRTSRDLADRRDRQQKLLASVQANRAQITRTQDKLAALARNVDRELAAAVQAEQERQAAAAEAAAAQRRAEQQRKAKAVADAAASASARVVAARQAATATAASGRAGAAAAQGPNRAPNPTGASAAPVSSPEPIRVPPTSPAAAIAVAEALRQLGKPYVFGTNGPNTFDCSGLTQWAWAKAGVAMAHYTVSQYQAFAHVPVDQLQPGDLVFFNIDLGHMGMYIGNGQIVQAPRTGDVVKVSPLSGRNLVGVVRPG